VNVYQQNTPHLSLFSTSCFQSWKPSKETNTKKETKKREKRRKKNEETEKHASNFPRNPTLFENKRDQERKQTQIQIFKRCSSGDLVFLSSSPPPLSPSPLDSMAEVGGVRGALICWRGLPALRRDSGFSKWSFIMSFLSFFIILCSILKSCLVLSHMTLPPSPII